MCNGAVKIRDVRPGDRDTVLAITITAFEQYAELMPDTWSMYRNNIQETLADPAPAQQILAESEGVVVGAVLLYPAGFQEPVVGGLSTPNPWPVVRLLAVPPAARARGIGRALMNECIRRARSSGSKAVILHSGDMMKAALGLYQGMGFVRDPSLDLQVAPGVIIDGYRLDFAD